MTESTPLDRFVDGMAVHFGVDPAITHGAGWTAAPMAERAESRLAVAYSLRDHVVVPCPPGREAEVVAGPPSTPEDWVTRMTAAGAELLGSAVMQTLGADGLRPAELADGFTFRRLTPADADVRDQVATLAERCSADDLDQADIDLDELDETIVLVLSAEGRPVAYASSRPWDEVERFGDIGVLVDPDHRRLGLGAAVVTEMCRWLIEDGIDPLYRRNDDNDGSVRLSLGLGFVPATHLVAVQFPEV